MLAYLLQGLILGATAAAQPGPFQAFLLSLISREGWRRALPAALAPLISDGPILALVLLVLSRLPEWSLSGLQIAGGLFLLYLAWGAWRSFRQELLIGSENVALNQGDERANIFKAALMNFLNPSPYIFWGTVAGPILIEAWRKTPLSGLGFLVSFYVALIGGTVLFILVFAGAGKLDPRVNRFLGAASAVALFAFGLFQLTIGIRGIATFA